MELVGAEFGSFEVGVKHAQSFTHPRVDLDHQRRVTLPVAQAPWN
jgi:hypothetical protein